MRKETVALGQINDLIKIRDVVSDNSSAWELVRNKFLAKLS